MSTFAGCLDSSEEKVINREFNLSGMYQVSTLLILLIDVKENMLSKLIDVKENIAFIW